MPTGTLQTVRLHPSTLHKTDHPAVKRQEAVAYLQSLGFEAKGTDTRQADVYPADQGSRIAGRQEGIAQAPF
jgi:hypothetical protein